MDLLRFAAVALVLLRHLFECPAKLNAPLNAIATTVKTGGWIGVDLFFVLSGFLISGLLFREHQSHGTISLKRFYIRRGLKIYPPFWAFIAFALYVEIAQGGGVSAAATWLPSELLFVQNYGTSCSWAYTWSLAVEEHFYLVLPLVLVGMAMRFRSCANPFRYLPRLFVIVATLCLLSRVYLAVAHPFSYKTHYFPTHLRIDSLLFGVLISYWYHFHPERFYAISKRYRALFIPLGVLLMLPAFAMDISTPYIYTVGFTQLYIASGLLLVGFPGKELKPNPALNLVAFLGSRSYSIYLWHGAATWFANQRFELSADLFNWSAWTINYLGGAVFMGVAMAALVEFPVIKLRDRLFPSRTTQWTGGYASSKTGSAAGEKEEIVGGALPLPANSACLN